MSIFPENLLEKARAVAAMCLANSLTIATAESCTGGLLSALFTELSGSSAWYTHGFVTYANEAKSRMLGVDAALIAQHGAVSESVAQAMAQGALSASQGSLAIAITGIAGPGGGTETKPVGLVHITVAQSDGTTLHQRCQFEGDRSAIRLQAVERALAMLLA